MCYFLVITLGRVVYALLNVDCKTAQNDYVISHLFALNEEACCPRIKNIHLISFAFYVIKNDKLCVKSNNRIHLSISTIFNINLNIDSQWHGKTYLFSCNIIHYPNAWFYVRLILVEKMKYFDNRFKHLINDLQQIILVSMRNQHALIFISFKLKRTCNLVKAHAKGFSTTFPWCCLF